MCCLSAMLLIASVAVKFCTDSGEKVWKGCGDPGAAFIHAAANLLVTAGRHVELAIELAIELPKGATVVTEAAELVSGGQACYPTSWGANLPLGSLQFGQEREVLLRIRGVRESGDQWTVSAQLKYEKQRQQRESHHRHHRHKPRPQRRGFARGR